MVRFPFDLYQYARKGDNEGVRMAIDYGCGINKADGCGKTPLEYAVTHNHNDTVELLLNCLVTTLDKLPRHLPFRVRTGNIIFHELGIEFTIAV